MKKQLISIVLLATILLQSCVAYQKTSVSINEAFEKGSVKVISTDGGKKKYMNITMEDSIYYGFGTWGWVRLDTNYISKIYLEDIKKSKKNKSAVIAVTVTVVVLVVVVGLVIWFLKALEEELNSI